MCWIILNYRWVKLSGTDLLPGDVVSIGRSSGQNGEDKSVPADMLLLAGSAIVNEAILTGESTPQWKVVLVFWFTLLLPLFFISLGHIHIMCFMYETYTHIKTRKEYKVMTRWEILK